MKQFKILLEQSVNLKLALISFCQKSCLNLETVRDKAKQTKFGVNMYFRCSQQNIFRKFLKI